MKKLRPLLALPFFLVEVVLLLVVLVLVVVKAKTMAGDIIDWVNETLPNPQWYKEGWQ